MDASGADKRIMLVQTHQVGHTPTTNLPPGTKSKTPLKRVTFGRLVLRLVSIVSVLLIYFAVSRFSFLGGGVTEPLN